MEKDLHSGLRKAKVLSILVLSFFILSIAVAAHSWQGRMGGMGDPFGLIEDESDFLIHPSGIANGRGMDFYGGYRLNYRDVMNWNYTSSMFYGYTPWITWPYRGSGDEWEHNGLIGAAFPLGAGRMGLFFEYAGKRGDYDGYEKNRVTRDIMALNTYQLESDLDAVALRLLYGLPMGGVKLGGEMQFAYRREKNETFYKFMLGKNQTWTNEPFSGNAPEANLFLFMIPYDSRYWETLLKGSLEGRIGPAKIAFTLRGSFTFSADNEYKTFYYDQQTFDMDGDVKAWRMGGDLWLRYPLAENLSLPFLLEIEYQKKTRDGDGQYSNYSDTFHVNDYRNRESAFQMKVGGGVDKEFVKGTRLAAGIYYNYLQYKNTFVINDTLFVINDNQGQPIVADYNDYPDHREHQMILKLSGEKRISPIVALRMGLNFFYGWLKEDFKYNFETPGLDMDFYMRINSNTSLDGCHYGIGAWMGGTMKFERFSVEPFLGGGYQKLKMTGDGSITNIFDYGNAPHILDEDKARKEWSIGGGISIKF